MLPKAPCVGENVVWFPHGDIKQEPFAANSSQEEGSAAARQPDCGLSSRLSAKLSGRLLFDLTRQTDRAFRTASYIGKLLRTGDQIHPEAQLLSLLSSRASGAARGKAIFF